MQASWLSVDYPADKCCRPVKGSCKSFKGKKKNQVRIKETKSMYNGNKTNNLRREGGHWRRQAVYDENWPCLCIHFPRNQYSFHMVRCHGVEAETGFRESAYKLVQKYLTACNVYFLVSLVQAVELFSIL